MAKPMTRAEWENWVEKAWATAQESAKEPKEWVGLTDEEIKEIIGPWGDTPIKWRKRELFDQIEAKLKEKNAA
jgi:hypothetical protein